MFTENPAAVENSIPRDAFQDWYWQKLKLVPRKWIVLLACADWLARRWLAKYYSPSSIELRAKLEKSIIFLLIVSDIVVFGAIYSTCVVYTKTIINLGVSE